MQVSAGPRIPSPSIRRSSRIGSSSSYRLFATLLLAVAAAGVHRADDPPPPVEEPLDFLNELAVDQWVCCDPFDRLTVQLVAADGARPITGAGVEVVLIRQSHILQTAAPDAWGRVQFQAVTPGVYQLMVDSPTSYAQLPISVIARAAAVGLPESLRLPVITPNGAQPTDRVVAETIPWVDSPTPPVFEQDPLGQHRLPGANLIEADADGGLQGRLALLGVPLSQNALLGMRVAVVADGRIVVERPVAASGHFRIEALAPGGYGLVAFGPPGGIATSFRFIDRRADNRKLGPVTGITPATSLNLECYPLGFNPPQNAKSPDFLGRGLGTCCSSAPVGPMLRGADLVSLAIRQTEGYPINVSGSAGEYLLVTPLFEESYVPEPVWLPQPLNWP